MCFRDIIEHIFCFVKRRNKNIRLGVSPFGTRTSKSKIRKFVMVYLYEDIAALCIIIIV